MVQIPLLLAKLHFQFDMELLNKALDWEAECHLHVLWWKPALPIRMTNRLYDPDNIFVLMPRTVAEATSSTGAIEPASLLAPIPLLQFLLQVLLLYKVASESQKVT